VPSIVDIAVLHSESAVYYSDGETIRRYDLHSKKDAVAIEFPASLWASYFDFSPDGSHLAAVKSLMSYDIPEEDRKKLAPEKEIHIPERGKPFIISDLYLFTMSTREYLKIDEGVDYWRPYWSPDSRGIVYGARGSIYKFSMDSQKSELLREGSFPALSPDGIQIAYFLKGRLCWGTLFREQPEHTFEYKKITASAPWREANAAHWGTIDPLVLWSPDGKYLLFSYSGEFKFSLINQYWAGPIPMFMTDEVWSKIYILDAATEKIIYRDRIPGHNGRIIWVPKD
jgi:Tol biopolymer transport system component